MHTASTQQLSRKAIRDGYQQLQQHPIHLLDQHGVEQQHYLTWDGQWNHQWTQQHHDKLRQQRLSTSTSSTEPELENNRYS